MKKCISCGFEVSDEALFCSKCGASVSEVSTLVTVDDLPVVDELATLCAVQELYGKAYDLRLKLHDMEGATYPYECPRLPKYIEPQLIYIPEFQPVDLEPMPEIHPTEDQIHPRSVKPPPMTRVTQSGGFWGWGVATFIVICWCLAGGSILIALLSPIWISLAIVWILVSISVNNKIKRYKTIYDDAVRNEYDVAYRAAVSHIQSSSEYLELCKPIQESNDRKIKIQRIKYDEIYGDSIQANASRIQEAKDSYQRSVDNFYAVTLPNYKKDEAEWYDNYNAHLTNLQSEYHSTVHEISTMLDNCGSIPSDYYDVDHINELVQIMQSSNYTIKEAIEIYDRRRQRELMDRLIATKQQEAQRLSEQNDLLNERNQLLYAQNQIAETNAYLVAEANAIADEARRDANRAELVRAVQHHNTNKYLKSMSKR